MNQSGNGVLVIAEHICKSHVSMADAFTAVETTFAAMDSGVAVNFPVVRQALGHADALYGFKSGFDMRRMTLGIKSGGYWPRNIAEWNIANHQSTILLFDPDSGRLQAVVGGNYLTALRTAAASAVSIMHLARADAAVLGIIGAGQQAPFQLKAALAHHAFQKVVAWNRSAAALTVLGDICAEKGVPFEAVPLARLAASADVIITITAAHAALLQAETVRPGTHIAAMGTDTRGKQELDPALCAVAALFTDDVTQSVSIGEMQHAAASGAIGPDDITPIGAVINKTASGRPSDDAVTIFDGTGVGLQDLAMARVAVQRALQAGVATHVAI
jgi:alanine dehydrogenase